MATQKVNTTTQNVGSHLGVIQFGPCHVPIGFLASFRKPSHLVCMSGKGFKTVVLPKEGKSQLLCECAVERATKRLNQVKRATFETLADEWLAGEKLAIAENHAKCFKEGAEAEPGGTNPYPGGSDQHLAWSEGFGSKEKEIP